MRLIKKSITSKNSSGFIKIQGEETEDMYYMYNLIAVGDRVVATSVRNVVKENNAGITSKKRITLKLKIQVERIEFDVEQSSLRLNGRNVEENEHLKMGQYHTLELEIGHPVGIEKDCWDSIYLQNIDDACDISKRAELAAILMQEGLANICLVSFTMTLTKLKIEKSLPKKRQGGGGTEYEKAKIRFFNDIFEGIRKYIDFNVVKVILIGSPGFLKDDFMVYYESECIRRGETEMSRNKTKFVKAHASSGHRRALDEILSDPALQNQLSNVKAADEVRALQLFHTVLGNDPDRACYGPKDVIYADNQLAIDQLLITDTLFRASDIPTRQKYVQLVDSVKEHGGQVYIFSSLHVSGAQLALYTGLAAILRYPLVIPEDLNEINQESKISTQIDLKGGEENDSITQHDQNIIDMFGNIKV